MSKNTIVHLTVSFMFWGMSMRANAQDRMPSIPAEKLTQEQKKAIADFKAARNAELSGPFIPMLHSPEVMTRARAMGDYLRYKSVLPPKLSEFVILITARQWTQQYEWHTHYQIALDAGLSPMTAKAIAEGRRPERMAPDEEILYDFCMELQHNKSVSDATYNRIRTKFGEQGVIDTVGIVGYYTLLAMVMNTTRTPVPGAATPDLAPFPQ
jgi:4-carboxymuconolactone decarboxylase